MLQKFKKDFLTRQKYVQPSRVPYFKLAEQYFPPDTQSIVVDIGPGDASFEQETSFCNRYPNAVLLDSNKETVSELQNRFLNTKVQLYKLPEQLPFKDKSVSFIHLSHIVEHLSYIDLYSALKEIDRVLDSGGIIVISTPLMWDRFWDDFSHVRPYNPAVFINYLVTGRENATASEISLNYLQRELVYRHRSVELFELTSRFFIIYALLRIFRVVLTKLGFRRYIKNGYTIVLQKK